MQGKGEAAGALYGILKGEVRVGASSLSEDEIAITRLQPGHWFGEIAILDGGVRTHDAHTVIPSVIALLPKHAILALCQRYPELYKALVALLCAHCRLALVPSMNSWFTPQSNA